jgi:hypothetical protein
MEDCRLLLKNAVEIKLKASSERLRVVFCELFFGTSLSICQGLTHQGGPQRLRISLALFWPDSWYSFLRGLRGWPIKGYNWYLLLSPFQRLGGIGFSRLKCRYARETRVGGEDSDQRPFLNSTTSQFYHHGDERTTYGICLLRSSG